MRKAVIAGSGAGASITAMTLTEAGWHVVMLEKGPHYVQDVRSNWPPTATDYSNDELKNVRFFEDPDPAAYPRTFRASPDEPASYVGPVNELPVVVGGGTTHYGAAMPRFWDLDFQQRSMLGPQPGADVADWPFTYADLAPCYDAVERLIGVQGDAAGITGPARVHAPRSGAFPMPPGPQQRDSILCARGARALGWHPFAFPQGINSRPYHGRPACSNCGFCNAQGCVTGARGSALDPLRRALRTGRLELRAETTVTRVVRSGRRRGLRWVDSAGRTGVETGDVVVLAASAVESSRLALLSGLPDAGGRIGTRLMFHAFTSGFGVFLTERLHNYRNRGVETQCMEDFNDPDFPGARAFARANGLPYLRGGLCELGGGQRPIGEALTYQGLLQFLQPQQPFGRAFKQLMRASLLRDRFTAVAMVGTDLPYAANSVTLDPTVRDVHGTPVPRITWAPGRHEELAQEFYAPKLVALLTAAGADAAGASPVTVAGAVPDTKHVLGGMAMGTDPATSVTDPWGRVHGTDDVYVNDGALFTTSGGANPTLTLMAVALRNARHLAR